MSRNRRIVLLCLAVCLAISSTLILTACKQQTYSVYYDKGNGSATGEAPQAQEYKVGDTVTVADVTFQLDGHEFTGWSDGSNIYKKGDTFVMPDHDVTLTAQWRSTSAADTYSVRYEKGNSSATGTAPETKSYKTGDNVTVAANTFTLANHEFAGWSDGSKTYRQGDTFSMPARDVTLTAQWTGGQPDDKPTLAELNAKVYDASNWEYMTNNNGASNDGGDIVYALNDGSVKFHRANQAVNIGEKLTNASFMIKSTHDFKLWFNSNGKDNANNNSYRLSYEYGELRISVSTAGDKSAARVTSTFELGKWNRIDIEFEEAVDAATERTVCSIKLYVNGERATLAAGENTTQITVADNVLKHTQVGSFKTGTWLVAKVWDACDFFQIKPVANADVKDVPIIAAIGASITEGAGASNFYTESYPAQLQNKLGGAYNVVNFGKSGRTVRTDTGVDANGEPVPWLQNKQWGGVQAIVPDIAIINMGTNDSKSSNDPATTKENFAAAYNHLLDELLAVNSDMRIIICTVPYAYSSIYDISNDNIRDIVAPVQREIAAERDMELVDLYEITQNKSLLFGDGVHPGTRGYAMFVEVLSKVIAEGDEALTKEFLDAIDAEYNDPVYNIENIKAALSVNEGQLILTVTGKIEFEDTSYIRLVAEISDEHERYQAITLNPDGTFSVSMRIDDLTSNEWYIIRIYLTESFAYVVTLDDTDHAQGDVVATATRKATVVSWSNRFNLKIEDNNYVNLTSSAITTTDGVKLTLTGTTNADALRLYLGVNPAGDVWREYVDVVITDGAFTVTYDLDKLFAGADIATDYVNVRLYFGTTTSYFVVPLAATTVDGQPATAGASFNTADKTITIVSWTDSGTGTLSFTVAEYNPLAPLIEVTRLEFNEGYLVITGTANDAVETLRLYLYNTKENIDAYFADVTLTDGTFTAQIGLEQLTLADNEWYYLWSSINGGDKQNVKYNHDESIVHQFEDRVYKFTGWGGNVAIVYTTQTVSENTATLNSVTVAEQDGKINLTIEGTTNDNGIRFYVGADPKDDSKYNHYENITVGANGEFTVTFDLATCPIGGWYNIRMYFTDGEYYAVSYEEAVNASGVAIKTDDVFYATDKSVTVKSWNDKGGLVKTFSIEVKEYDSSYTVTATSIAFDNGYFVLSGTVRNVRNLYVYLINTNVAASADNYVEAVIDGSSFTARLPLATLQGYNKTNTPFNLRYKVNDVTASTVNVAPAEMDMTQVYWTDASCFYLGTNNNCVAVYYRQDKYVLNEVNITVIDGKATLVIAGTTTAAYDGTLYLLLDETADGTGKQKLIVANKSATEGAFRFEVDISELESSEEAGAANGAASRHYYIRLHNGTDLTPTNTGTKYADINSRWLADRLFKAINVAGDSSDYYFIRNTTNTTYNTLGIVRVGKDVPTAIKLGDIDDITLNYCADDSKTVDLSQYVNANGTTVTYNVTVANQSIAAAAVSDGILTVTACGFTGTTAVTVEVLSDGVRAFELQFEVALEDSATTKTNNYASFLDAASWLDIVGDGNDRPWLDGSTNSMILQWGNVYQEIGKTSHISFELWVNASGDFGFEIWFRSTTNDKSVTGSKYVLNGYSDPMTISREDGTALASLPRFTAGAFTRFDIVMLDVYEGDNVVKTLINVYINGQKVALSGNSVINGTIEDNAPIDSEAGKYFALKSWAPQIAIRPAAELADPNAIKIAAVGDSITYGHSWHNESYPVYLAEQLGGGYNVGNFGLNGASVTGFGGSSLKYANQQQYTDSVNFPPDVIVIMLGANDANGWANASVTYETELRALIAAYQAACPNAKILLVTSAPTLDNNQFGIPNDVIKNNVNAIQRSVAQDLGLTLVDLNAEMTAAEGGYNGFFRGDGVHLSVEGAQFTAKVIGDAVKAL